MSEKPISDKPERTGSPTTYIVLTKRSAGGVNDSQPSGAGFELYGEFDGNGAVAALRAAADAGATGTLVAVPKSRWTERTVAVESVKRVTLS